MSMTADALPDRAPITISMERDLVVITPCAQLDHDSTEILVGALNAAVDAGSVVLVDLAGDGTSPSPFPAPSPGDAGGGPGAVAVGAACITLPSGSSHRMLDLERRRLCRSADPVDRRFVCAAGWVGVKKLWMSANHIAVLAGDNSFITTTTAAAA
jgi:hypothetical protein